MEINGMENRVMVTHGVGESLGRTEVVDEARQIGDLIENSVIPACVPQRD